MKASLIASFPKEEEQEFENNKAKFLRQISNLMIQNVFVKEGNLEETQVSYLEYESEDVHKDYFSIKLIFELDELTPELLEIEKVKIEV